MNYAKLLRGKSTDQGTPGRFLFAGRTAGSLELPDRGNKQRISCILDGTYRVKWTYSYHLRRYTYEIQEVEDRGGIRLHSGNFAGDVTRGYKSHSLGCPLLCRYFGTLSGQLAGLASRSVVSDLEMTFAKQPFELEILWT